MKIVYKNKNEINEIISKIIIDIINKKNNSILLLATGNTPIGIYSNLIQAYEQKKVSFKKITTFNLDEYIDIEKKFEKDSFKKFMNDKLFNFIDIDKSKIFFPKNEIDYNNKLDGIDYFDFTILGVGENGHIAFNEPKSKFETRTNIVSLTKSTLKNNFPNRTEYPTKAITMGLVDIYNKSNLICLVAFGETKKQAIKKFLENKIDDNWPITHFVNHKNIIIFTDLKEI